MLRLTLYLLLLASVATGLAWLADRPGSITLQWLGYEIQTSAFIGLIAFAILLLATLFAGWLLLVLWTGPRRVFRRLEARRRRMGRDAIRRGIFAAGAGDVHAASRAATLATKMVPDDPLALLLQAQSAQLIGDGIAARQSFERMLSSPEMSALGLRGLFLEAKRAGELEAAKQFAERSLATHPSAPWSSQALFELQAREGDWRGALRTLNFARQYRHVDREEANRRRAVALTTLAREIEDTDPAKAVDLALEAHALAPALVPAAVIAGRVLAGQGHANRAAKVIAQTWKLNPHPDLALIYAHARPGDSPRDRLARVKALAASAAPSPEADIAIATAAVEAKDWDAAREALAPRLAGQPTARVCVLMARIEAGQHRDKGRAREWLARAGRAAPDPAWVAPDGSVSREWLPVTPGGALGTYEWRTPPTANAPGAGEEIWAEIAAVRESDATPISGLGDPVIDIEPAETASPAAAPIAPARPATQDGMDAKAARATAETPVAIAPGHHSTAADQGTKQIGRGETPLVAEAEISTSAEPHGETRVAPAQTPSRPLALPEPRSRPKPRQPTIFVPGRAPDDPGPKEAEPEETSTPLTRYRQPV